ncbi:MAG: ABC transporter substrate-binding protein [Deinococcales bacterium]|nr:ABC transporter substrate-binding protein [Deinococcales bacterium]
MPLRCHPGSTLAEARAAARRLLLPLLAFALLAGAAAQPAEARVGVIASRTGSASAAGTAQWLLASDWARELQAQGGVFGVPVRLELRDDASSAPAARAHAQELVDAGALLLVCCTTPAASQAVAELAEAAGVPLLAPSALEPAAPYPYWAFTLFPDETDALAAIVADAYREGRPALALMALEGPLGDAASADLAALLALLRAGLTHEVRYPPGVQELRPEALLVASSQPGGVVVWGLADDLTTAYAALRRRGYEGLVYGRTALLQPGSPALPWPQLINARFALPPAAVPSAGGTAPADPYEPRPGTGGAAGACAAAGRVDAERLARVPGASANAVATAPFLAALDLAAAGLEQLIALQIPASEPPVLRQALRDAMVGRPARCTGAGLVDLRDGSVSAIEPGGLAVGAATRSGLAPLR